MSQPIAAATPSQRRAATKCSACAGLPGGRDPGAGQHDRARPVPSGRLGVSPDWEPVSYAIDIAYWCRWRC
jgi:hypothetical protein